MLCHYLLCNVAVRACLLVLINVSQSRKCKGTAAVLSCTNNKDVPMCVQANTCGTVYVEGVGLGCIAAGAKQITPDVMLAAAKAAAVKLTAEELQQGSILPQVDRIR